MKVVFLIFVSALIGFGLYPVLNPVVGRPSDHLLEMFQKFLSLEGRRYAEAESAEEKLRLADEMYGKMLLLMVSQLDLKGVPNRPATIYVSAQPEKKVFVEVPVPVVSERTKKSEESLSIRDKVFSDKLDFKTTLTFRNQPYLSPLDSRLVKLNGRFKGSLKRILGKSRTGEPEILQMEVSQNQTKIDATDTYDNETISIKEPTASLFRNVPGDENLLMILHGGQTMIFDLRSFPKISGRILSVNKVNAEFDLSQVKTK
jgi:hypothetical protein